MPRMVWNKRTAFMLAAIGSAVGLGNLWRFPYIAYENGGGAFLVPYFIALLTTGIPLLIGEYILGKRSGAGAPFSFKKISPRFEWVGWWAILTGFGIVTYYTVVMSWAWFYLAKSPWIPWADNAKAYFFGEVLKLSDGPMQLGGLVWPLVLGSLITWVLCFFIIRKGTSTVGKVVKWTVPLPYILLLILLVHGLARDGALEGLIYYLTPNWEILSQASTWLAAYGQIFFSLSLGFGIMIAYASYLKKEEDVSWQATVCGLANSATEFFAGFVVFSIIGALAAVLNANIADVAAAGPGLAFVTFPWALAELPLAPFFSLVFFAALLTLGIDSAFSLIEAVVAGLQDKMPNVSRLKLVISVCVVGFIVSLLFATKAGLYWLDIVDHWLNSYGLVGVGLATALLIGVVLKTSTLVREINEYTIKPVGKFWEVSVAVITPVVLTITLIFALKGELITNYGDYPARALAIGGWGVWGLTVVLAILLQSHRSKWFFLSVFTLAAVTMILALTYSTAFAMGIVGTVILAGGLIWMWMIAKRSRR